MSFNKKFFTTGGIVASTPSAPAGLDPLQNFETVTYTGNGSTQKITGYIRKGAAFNGSSSLITTPIGTAPSGGNSRTFSLWVNSTNTSSNQTLIMYGNANPPSRDFFVWRLNGGGSSTIEFSDFVDTYSESASSVFDGDWHHLAFVYNGSTIQYYVDGSPLGSGFSVSLTTANTIMGIGDYNSAAGAVLDGKIDQVRIFNKALDSGEVGQLALEDYTDPKKSTTDYFDDGSGVALYELDDNSLSSNFKQAAVFNGSSSYIQTTYNQNTTNAFTWSLWVNPTAIGSLTMIIGEQDNFSPYNGVALGLSASEFYLMITGTNTGRPSFGTPIVGSWQHIVVSYDGAGNWDLYQNNVKTTASYTATNGSNNLRLGNVGVTGWNSFNGSIDQVRIFNTALGQADVTKLYRESSTIPTANLIAHYKLDGDATDALDTYNGVATAVTYSNGVYGGTATNVNYLGMAFQPDLVWVKGRNSGQDNVLFDSVRGVQKQIISNFTDAESTKTNALSSFDSNGFTTGINNSLNANSVTYVAWCWKAGGSVTPNNNTEGSIASTVSANQDAGFSIVSFTAPSTEQNFTVGHGLSQKPDMVILKSRDGGAWFVWHKDLSQESYYLYLQETYSESDLTQDTRIWGQQSFTDSVISTRSNYTVLNNNDVIAYCFHSVDGYQKVGIYSGGQTLNTDNIVDFGFTPRFVIVKNITAATGWLMIDSIRPNGYALFANDFGTEADYSGHIKLSSSGLRFDGNNNNVNASGNNYIYLAIA